MVTIDARGLARCEASLSPLRKETFKIKFDLGFEGQKRSLKFRFAAFSYSHIFSCDLNSRSPQPDLMSRILAQGCNSASCLIHFD